MTKFCPTTTERQATLLVETEREVALLTAQAIDEHQRLKLGRQQATYAALLVVRRGLDAIITNPFDAKQFPALAQAWEKGITYGLSATVPDINANINGRLRVKAAEMEKLGKAARTHASITHAYAQQDSAA